MKEPVLILSDLHLGHKASIIDDVSVLAPLIRGAGTLLLNGDTWQELAREFQEQGKQLLDQFQQLCARLGVEILMLPGNHDPGSGSQGYTLLAEGKIVVTHGDCVFQDGAPWSRMAMKKQSEVAQLWSQHSASHIDDRLQLGREIARLLIPPHYPHSRKIWMRAWDAVMPPGRGLRMLIAWMTMVNQTRIFARRYFPDCEIILCGHFHRCGIWDDDELLVINSGSFMPPGGAYWCEWNNRVFTVGRVKKSTTRMERGEILGVWLL